MLVAVSVDMEGASQLRSVRETFGCMSEYWQNAAVAPFMPYLLSGFASADEADGADQERVGSLVAILDAWAAESHPQWYTEAADPFPAGVAEQPG